MVFRLPLSCTFWRFTFLFHSLCQVIGSVRIYRCVPFLFLSRTKYWNISSNCAETLIHFGRVSSCLITRSTANRRRRERQAANNKTVFTANRVNEHVWMLELIAFFDMYRKSGRYYCVTFIVWVNYRCLAGMCLWRRALAIVSIVLLCVFAQKGAYIRSRLSYGFLHRIECIIQKRTNGFSWYKAKREDKI